MQWGIAHYRDSNGLVLGAEFLTSCPTKVAANFFAVLEAVGAAPPFGFSGGGKWEAMHGTMAGYYEIHGTGPGRIHYRLFCVLENGTAEDLKTLGFDRPQIGVINGMSKSSASLFTDQEYRKTIRALGDNYLAQIPRPVAE
jgi:hypothetical protein